MTQQQGEKQLTVLIGTSTLESSSATAWQFYPLVASSSLLLVYLTFLVLRYSYSRSKLVQGWTRTLIGKPPKEEKMLLHTFPYYLAITRSSCEVSCQSRDLNFEFPRHMFSTFQLVIKPLTTPMTLSRLATISGNYATKKCGKHG